MCTLKLRISPRSILKLLVIQSRVENLETSCDMAHVVEYSKI